MEEIFKNSLFAGITLSLGSYALGSLLRKKFANPLVNPFLISVVVSIAVLVFCKIDYEYYYQSAKYMSFLLTPATVCLAVPLYEQLELLKKNFWAIILGIFAGALTSVVSILVLCFVLKLPKEMLATLLPKTVTTAIGMGVSAELGGYVTITVATIVVTGILGNVLADVFFRLFKITNPIAQGIALGTSAHAMGTAKAHELGQIQGAMSGLSIVITGIFTVILAPLFAGLYGLL